MFNIFRRKRSLWYWHSWYLSQLGQVSENTIQTRHAVFVNLEIWLQGRDILKVRSHDLPAFERFLSQNCAASSIHHYFVSVKYFFSLLVKHKHLKRSPFDDYKMPKKPKTAHRQYDFGEVVPRLLAACKNKRERFVIILAVMTGARIAELARMQWEDVDFDNGYIRVVGKGDKYREIVISEHLKGELQKNKNGSAYLIKNSRTGEQVQAESAHQTIKVVAKRAGIPKLTPHDLRRIYAGEFLRLGKDPSCLQEQLGHSDISTTLECYCVPTKSKKQEIVNGFELPG